MITLGKLLSSFVIFAIFIELVEIVFSRSCSEKEETAFFKCFIEPIRLFPPPVVERHNCTKLHNGNFAGGRVQRDEQQKERERASGGKEILFAFFREQNVELIFWIWKLFYILSIEEEEEAEEDEEEEAISRPLYTPQWNTPHTHTVTHNQT